MRPVDYRAWDTAERKMIYDFSNFAGWQARHEKEDSWKHDRYIKMQFTGLYDTNKPPRKIYEGDIVRCESVTGSPLYDTHIIFGLVEYHAPYFTIDGCYLWHEMDNIKVVGNIFENPELMEE